MKKVINNDDVMEFEAKGRQKLSFLNGYNQVPRGMMKEVRIKISNALSLRDRGTFYQRLNGKSSFNQAEITAIEGIFNEYGIENIWGDAE